MTVNEYDAFDCNIWPELNDWFIEQTLKMDGIFASYLPKAKELVKHIQSRIVIVEALLEKSEALSNEFGRIFDYGPVDESIHYYKLADVPCGIRAQCQFGAANVSRQLHNGHQRYTFTIRSNDTDDMVVLCCK